MKQFQLTEEDMAIIAQKMGRNTHVTFWYMAASAMRDARIMANLEDIKALTGPLVHSVRATIGME